MIVILLVLLGGGGAGAYFVYFKPAGETETKGKGKKAKEPEPEPADEATGIVTLEPFVVNLADQGVSRFLRCNLSLLVENEEVAKEFSEKPVELARVRSAILELLSQQHADELVTPEGKDALKKAIVERAAQAVPEPQVADVLFSEFVVQF